MKDYVGTVDRIVISAVGSAAADTACGGNIRIVCNLQAREYGIKIIRLGIGHVIIVEAGR